MAAVPAVRGSGVADILDRDILCLLRLDLVQVQRIEIDRFEQQWLEPAIAYSIGKHPPGEGKQQARCLAQQEWLDMFGRNIAQSEQPGKAEVHDKGNAIIGF
jgi:hypothetical protein